MIYYQRESEGMFQMFNVSRRLLTLTAAFVLGCSLGTTSAFAEGSQNEVWHTAASTAKTVTSTQNSIVLRKHNGNYYVNEHEITFKFGYHSEFYDKTAWYVSHLSTDSTPDTQIISAKVVDFDTTWDYSKSKQNVLAVKAVGLDGYVDRRSGGAYSNEPFTTSFDTTTLIIDPETGEVFDFIEFNYFYKFHYMTYHFTNEHTISIQES